MHNHILQVHGIADSRVQTIPYIVSQDCIHCISRMELVPPDMIRSITAGHIFWYAHDPTVILSQPTASISSDIETWIIA